MRIDRSGLFAITLSAIALLVAGAGTAVAVTASAVNIADPATPSHKARVDSSGRLSVGAPSGSLNRALYVGVGGGVLPLTSPTTATLAVSRLALENDGRNSNFPDTDFVAALVRITVNTSGQCYGAGTSQSAPYSVDRLPVGSNVQDAYPAPLVFKPKGKAKYCIGLVMTGEAGNPNGGYYTPFVQLTGFPVSGTYSGLGTSALARPLSNGPRLMRSRH